MLRIEVGFNLKPGFYNGWLAVLEALCIVRPAELK
jgi:hypothetical protein